MKKCISLFMAISLIANIICKAEIREINSIKEAQNILYQADENTLVIFDLDATMIEFANKIAQTRFANTPFVKQFMKRVDEFVKNKTKENPGYPEYFSSKTWINIPSRFVEPEIPEIIHHLQAQSIKVIALTAQPTGPHGLIPNYAHFRFERLRDMGIDLSSSFPEQTIIFKQLMPFKNHYPMFYHGMLSSVREGGNKKGPVLAAFLDEVQWKPKKIIFIDDDKHNLESVQQEMKLQEIPSICFWYRAALQPDGEIDQTIAEFEFNHLQEYDECISDEQATALIALQRHLRTP